jgi:hypothetical protein
MDVTGVLAVKIDPGMLQMKQDLNPAPAQALLPTAAKATEPSDSSHQAGYQRQQSTAKDTVELRKRNEEWSKPKLIPSPPEFEFHLAGAPKDEEFPAMPNSRAIEVIRRYEEIAQDETELEKQREEALDIAA